MHNRLAHARWEIFHLTSLARSGSLAAARELMRRAVAHWDDPELRDPVLSEWMKDFLSRAATNPRESVGRLIAPPGKHLRPRSHGELIDSLSLTQEIYLRVRKAVEAGTPLKTACNLVAEQLNALGFENVRKKPLRPSSVERHYYAIHRRKPPARA